MFDGIAPAASLCPECDCRARVQMDARFGKMIRDREAAQAEEQPLQVGDEEDGLGFDEDPSLEYVAYEQHRCGLLGRFLQDSVRTPPVPTTFRERSRPTYYVP